MRVLMLGWEFPPYITGGLGTACYGLAKAINRLETDVLFVLPRAADSPSGARAVPAPIKSRKRGTLRFMRVPSRITNPYQMAGVPQLHATGDVDVPPSAHESGNPDVESADQGKSQRLQVIGTGAAGGYDGDLVTKITDYARHCLEVTKDEPFDVVHAHDWLTFPAAIEISRRANKPMIAHVHATEFDRSGSHVHQPIYNIERQGMHAAAKVIAVSQMTKQVIVSRYGVPAERVEVVHNGVEAPAVGASRPPTGSGPRTVLFLGRITMQKGPGYFVSAAARVLQKRDDVRFVIAGWGDMGPSIVQQVAAMGLGNKVFFAGFLQGDEVDRAFRMADVYVMSSISEPFGLTALESVRNGTPVVLSKTSGVAEVLTHGALKVDFWDVDMMASHILSILRYPELAQGLRCSGLREIRHLTWDAAAAKCQRLYEQYHNDAELN